MKIKTLRIFIYIFLSSTSLFAQDTLIVMTYNVLNFPGSTPDRVSSFAIILDQFRPDILVVSEMQTEAGMNLFLEEALNHSTEEYSAGNFINGTDTDNSVFYKHDKVNFVDNLSISTRLRLINGYRFTIKNHADTTFQFQVFSAHLKAVDSSTDANRRLAEVDDFNRRILAGRVDSSYIFAGDLNIYRSSEPAYQFLMNSMAIDLEDPIDSPGNWHVNSSFKSIHTQSTMTTSTKTSNGSTGGLDDRFDFILLSERFFRGQLLRYVDGSYETPGNTGLNFNSFVSDINFRTASDHLPVLLKIEYPTDALTPLEFSAIHVDNGLLLKWNSNVGGNLDFFALYRSTQIDFDPDTMATYTFATTDSFFLDSTIIGEETYYRISSFDESGNESPFSKIVSNLVVSIAEKGTLPLSYTLYQNYPNPFNPVTSINYILPKESMTTLTIYNLLGQEVAKLVNRVQSAGIYSIKWNASNVSTGVYFYKLQSGDFVQTRKMVLLK
ncbi:MAG: T9SS type A sorting domain-containing protein [Candidatus Marinimicrobia bacterium]|nr:T9SS type A sorting domain-containing protein [Candidatus Neomarinimicrobiota bacterium]